jgi:hypothetical protein
MESRYLLEGKEMTLKTSLVVISINRPTESMWKLAEGAKANKIKFFVIGDLGMPSDFAMADGELYSCNFYGVDKQLALDFKLVKQFPPTQNCYARKNIGYLLAMQAGAQVIKETDDDNFPMPGFWKPAPKREYTSLINSPDWVNVYRYFTANRQSPDSTRPCKSRSGCRCYLPPD